MSNSLPSTYQPLPAAAVQKLNARNQKLARKKTSHSPVKLIWARKFHSQVPLNLFERKKKKRKKEEMLSDVEFFLRSRNLQMSDSNKIIFALIFFFFSSCCRAQSEAKKKGHNHYLDYYCIMKRPAHGPLQSSLHSLHPGWSSPAI